MRKRSVKTIVDVTDHSRQHLTPRRRKIVVRFHQRPIEPHGRFTALWILRHHLDDARNISRSLHRRIVNSFQPTSCVFWFHLLNEWHPDSFVTTFRDRNVIQLWLENTSVDFRLKLRACELSTSRGVSKCGQIEPSLTRGVVVFFPRLLHYFRDSF